MSISCTIFMSITDTSRKCISYFNSIIETSWKCFFFSILWPLQIYPERNCTWNCLVFVENYKFPPFLIHRKRSTFPVNLKWGKVIKLSIVCDLFIYSKILWSGNCNIYYKNSFCRRFQVTKLVFVAYTYWDLYVEYPAL